MGGSKILATISDIFSSVADDDDYQDSVIGDRRSSRAKGQRRKANKTPTSILATGTSDIFSTIDEEDYQAKHAAEVKRKDKARKKKSSKIMSTLNDIFGTHQIEVPKKQPKQTSERPKANGSRRDVRRIDLSQYEDPEAQLARERERAARAEKQIQTLVAMNRDLQEQAVMLQEESNQDVNRNVLNLKLRFNREEKSRLEAERREYLALKELENLRAALAASHQRRQQVEDELTHAASDILDTRSLHNTCQDLQKSYQGAVKQEREAWQTAQRLKREVEALETRLQRSERERQSLLGEVARLKKESQHWEKALDDMQEQLDNVLAAGTSDAVMPRSNIPENGIAEIIPNGKHEAAAAPQGTTSNGGPAASSDLPPLGKHARPETQRRAVHEQMVA